MTQWHTQAGNITTNLKVKLYFTLPAFRGINVVTCICHVNESTKGRYEMILVRDLLTQLGSNLYLSEKFIEADDGHFKGSTTPIIDLGTYIFKDLHRYKITPEFFKLMLTLKNYLSQNMYVLLRNEYV